MNIPKLEYYRARTVEEALTLRAGKKSARYLAGGTDLLSQVRGQNGDGATPIVIDIKNIAGLSEIHEHDDGSVSIGATATVANVANHPLIRERYPVLSECCLSLGSYPLRNLATVAGNICNASPCADTAAALMALDAVVLTRSPGDRRQIAIRDFFEGPGDTNLRLGELVTAIKLPSVSAGGNGHYGRIARRQSVDISTVAVLVTFLAECTPKFRISLLSVAPTPLRVPEAEQLLDSQGAGAAGQAAEIARSACNPISDVRGSAEYRREMVGVLVERGVRAVAGWERG